MRMIENNSKREKQVFPLIIPSAEGWYYPDVKKYQHY